MTGPTLKPCPFCGGVEIKKYDINGKPSGAIIVCGRCGAGANMDAWNTRADLRHAALAKQRELRHLLEKMCYHFDEEMNNVHCGDLYDTRQEVRAFLREAK